MNAAFQSAMRNLFSETKPFFEARTMFNPERVDADSSVATFLLSLGEVASVSKPVGSQFKLCRIGSGSFGFLPPPEEGGKIMRPT